MSLEQLVRANELINQIRKERNEKESKHDEVFMRTIEESPVKDRRPPRDFKDSSYLFIRSYDGDNGSRPGLNVPYWRSPDVKISPLSSLYSYTTELKVGDLNNINCLVHNGGDLIVPSAKVEFYLITPSLGMDTRFGKKMGVVSTWVNSYSSAEVNLQYLIPPSDAGHRCLFARVFSFSPLDIPIHDTLLTPTQDRRIGQKNLNIATQGTQMQLNILHMPQAQIKVSFQIMNREAILALQHPSAKDFKVIDNIEKLLNQFEVEFVDKDANSNLKAHRGIVDFEFSNDGKFNLDRQKEIGARMKEIYYQVNFGKTRANEFKEQIEEYRQMNLENSMTLLNLQIPKLGLKEGEMTGFEIIANNNLNGEVLGGMTLLVIG